MVIAFGAGITAGSVLASDEVASLDVVDLNPDIEGINDLFTEVNGDVFHQDRFHFHNDDGRNYLVTSNKQYDLIIGDSTHPRAYDSWILYTEEFYESVKSRLKPGGIFAQWVPVLGSMRGELFRIHLNTFRSVFPNATVLVRLRFGPGLPAGHARAPADRRGPAAGRSWTGCPRGSGPASTSSTRSSGSPASSGWTTRPIDRMIAGETRINTDDVHYFDKQSAVWPLPPAVAAAGLPGQRRSPTSRARMPRRGGDHRRAGGGRPPGPLRLLPHRQRPAPGLVPGSGQRQRALLHGRRPSRTSCRRTATPSAPSTTSRPTASRGQQHPDNAVALNGLADALSPAGQLRRGAAPCPSGPLALDPDNGMLLDTQGWILFRQSRHDAALDLLEAANEALNGHPIVYYHLGATRLAAGDEEGARRALERALAHGDEFEGHETARELLESLD